jgi:regulator of RNase E activity RraA
VEVFGRIVRPGQLIHADKHGFLAIPPEDESRLLEAAVFMDGNECNTVISAARTASEVGQRETLERLAQASADFRKAAKSKFDRQGEW